MNSIVACCHGAKLCAYAARDFRWQHLHGDDPCPVRDAPDYDASRNRPLEPLSPDSHSESNVKEVSTSADNKVASPSAENSPCTLRRSSRVRRPPDRLTY